MNEAWYQNDDNNYIAEPSDADDVTIKTWHIILFFVLGLIVAVLSGVRSTEGSLFGIARGILGILLVTSIFLPVRWGIPLLTLLLLVGPDLAQSSSEIATEGEFTLASVWRTWLGPVAPSRVIAACCIIQIIKIMKPVFDKSVKRVIVWFATIPVLTGWVYGGFTSPAHSIEVASDARFAMMLIISVVLFHSFLRRYPGSLGVILAILVGALLSRHLCDIIYWFIGYGPRLAGAGRASVDSSKSTVVLVLLLGIFLVMVKKRLVLGTILALGSGVLVVIYGTRMIWVTSALCAFVLLYIFGARKAIVMAPLIFILVVATLKIVQSVREESMEMAAERSESFTYAVTGTEGNFLFRLEPVRYIELVNSMNTSMNHLSFLWGNGYGSYYTDDVLPFPANLLAAHPEYSAMSGQFYYCHNFLFQMLFKHGLIGAIIIWSLWLWPAWVCYKHVFDRTNRGMFNGILGCFIAFIPSTIINLYWTGKGVFISGFIIAILLFVIEQHQQFVAETHLAQLTPDMTEQPGVYLSCSE